MSGVHLLSKEVNMNEFDALSGMYIYFYNVTLYIPENYIGLYILDISHISGFEMSVDSPPSIQVPAPTTSNQPITCQWKDDDQSINNYTFNINNDHIGLNPDLIEILQNGNPLAFYLCIVSNEIITKNSYRN